GLSQRSSSNFQEPFQTSPAGSASDRPKPNTTAAVPSSLGYIDMASPQRVSANILAQARATIVGTRCARQAFYPFKLPTSASGTRSSQSTQLMSAFAGTPDMPETLVDGSADWGQALSGFLSLRSRCRSRARASLRTRR